MGLKERFTVEEAEVATREDAFAYINDMIARGGTNQVGMWRADFLRNEIADREQRNINKSMLKMTVQMRNMTIAITLLTIVNVIVAVVALCHHP